MVRGRQASHKSARSDHLIRNSIYVKGSHLTLSFFYALTHTTGLPWNASRSTKYLAGATH